MRGFICQWDEHFGVGIIAADGGREFSVREADLLPEYRHWPTIIGQNVEFAPVNGAAKNVRQNG